MLATTRRSLPSTGKTTLRSRTSRRRAGSAVRSVASAVAVTPSLGTPAFGPVRAEIPVAGGLVTLEPFRHDMGVGAEEQRQGGQLAGVDRLHLGPGAPL